MSLRTKRVEPFLQLDSGLIIPTGAGTGKALTSDSSGSASWGVVPLAQPAGAMLNPTRLISTAYQPNVTRPTLLVITIDTANSSGFCTLRMDASNPPTTTIAQFFNNAGRLVDTATCIVPPSFYYLVFLGGGTPSILTTFEYAL